jgi:hypothetical protein
MHEREIMTIAKQIGLITFFLFVIGSFSIVKAETLKQYSTVCRTKEEFNEIVNNRDDKAYVMKMLADGKCIMNVTGAMPIKVLEGVFPLVKIMIKWGDKTFIGWTDTSMIIQ